MMSHLAGAKARGEREWLLEQERRLKDLEDTLQCAGRRQAETNEVLIEAVRKHESTQREITHLRATVRAARQYAKHEDSNAWQETGSDSPFVPRSTRLRGFQDDVIDSRLNPLP